MSSGGMLRGALMGLVAAALAVATPVATVGGRFGTQQPTVFRSGAIVVPIDLRVLDRAGQPITTLKASDITVFEDGVRQEISYFAALDLQPDATAAPARLAARTALTESVAPQPRRVFLVVLGRGRLQEPAKGLDALLAFVRARLMPQDLIAVLAYDRATDFTTDHGRIAQVLERFKRQHERIEQELRAQFTGLAALYGSKNVPPAIQKSIDAVFLEPGTAGTREVAPAIIGNADRLETDARRTAEILSRPGALDPMSDVRGLDASFGDFVAANRQTMQDVGNLYTGIEYLRQLDGEKHLIFVTEQGIGLPRLEDDKSLAAVASDARVAITTIQTGGIMEPAQDPRTPGVPPPPGAALRQAFFTSTLKTVAELTGGQSFVNDYAATALDRVNAATRAGYLLGYTPANSTLDGRYRRITVQITHPDAQVIHRRGYYSRAQLTSFDRRHFVTQSRMNAAASLRRDIRDIKLSAKSRLPEPGREVWVDLTIDASRVHFDTATSERVATVVVALVGLDGSLRSVGQSVEEVVFRLTDPEYLRVRKDGLTYRGTLPLTPNTRSVKIVVYDYVADLLGTMVTTVR